MNKEVFSFSAFCRFWLPLLVAASGCRFWLPFDNGARHHVSYTRKLGDLGFRDTAIKSLNPLTLQRHLMLDY
jgi:hypothetical protein